MLRFPAVLSKTRTYILHLRKQPELKGQSIPISRSRHFYKKPSDQEREVCEKKPPPPRKRLIDDRLIWGTLAVLIMTGSFAVYAKQSPEVRDWLTIHLPWFDDLIAIMYQENLSYMQLILCTAKDAKEYLVNFIDYCVMGKPAPEKPKKKKKLKALSSDCSAPPRPPPSEVKDDDAATPSIPGYDDSLTPEESPCDKVSSTVVMKDICELQNCLADMANTVINNYYTASQACAYYNEYVEDVMKSFTYHKLKELRPVMAERLAVVEKHLNKAVETEALLNQGEDQLTRAHACNAALNPERVANAKQVLGDLRDKIAIMRSEYLWNNDHSISLDHAWQMVEGILDVYAEDNSSVYYILNYCNRRPDVEKDLDWLLHHTRRYIEKISREVNEQAELVTEKINRGIELIPGNPADTDAKVKKTYGAKAAELNQDYAARINKMAAESERETKMLLEEAEEKHKADLAAALDAKEAEVMDLFNQMVSEAVDKEKKIMNETIKEMSIKLKAVQSNFLERSKADRERNRSRALYDAGAALLAKCKKGDPLVSVEEELEAIERNRGFCDELVNSVLRAIPESVRSKGIVPESIIHDRYHHVENIAMQVAMVDGDGAPLPIYAMSLIQSILLFMKLSMVPEKELESPPKEPFEGYDTFDKLQRARYFMEKRNLTQALRWVESLEGASKSAALRWMEDARAYLETRQCAEAVLAHAAALGLKYM